MLGRRLHLPAGIAVSGRLFLSAKDAKTQSEIKKQIDKLSRMHPDSADANLNSELFGLGDLTSFWKDPKKPWMF